jgi:uncharacterized protein YjbJ (UPF0337 family)
MGELAGKITEKLGQYTNDRETEAHGRVEQESADGEVDETELEEEVDDVRAEHGDLGVDDPQAS